MHQDTFRLSDHVDPLENTDKKADHVNNNESFILSYFCSSIPVQDLNRFHSDPSRPRPERLSRRPWETSAFCQFTAASGACLRRPHS